MLFFFFKFVSQRGFKDENEGQYEVFLFCCLILQQCNFFNHQIRTSCLLYCLMLGMSFTPFFMFTVSSF